MRAGREPVSSPTVNTRSEPRVHANVTVIRGGSVSPVPRAYGPRFGRVLFALLFVLLLIFVLSYGVGLAAGPLRADPLPAMIPSTLRAFHTLPLTLPSA